MKKIYSLFVFIILLTGIAEKTFATHAVGADLTYTCLGGNNYRFYFTLYRDCVGIAVSPWYTIQGTSSCGGSLNITVNLDSTIEVINTCPSIVTQCVNFGSPYMGIQANYYHGDITLPSVCNYWTFGIDPAICNRNAAINNLTPNGATYCMYVEATLNNDAVQCNSSPMFSTIPAQFLSAGQVQFFNQGAYDIDGDSLTYEMITPHSDVTSDVIYNPGLTATQPITYIDSTQFDPVTGNIRFYADVPQITVIAVLVREYRNGILIGSVERDIELIFQASTNNIPSVTGFNGTPFYVTHVCADSILMFYVRSIDPDPDDTYLSWDGGIPGAIFTTSGTHRDTGYFAWTPGLVDISFQPHIFTVTVTDNACPVIGVSTFSYAIYVDKCFATDVPLADQTISYFSADYLSTNNSIHFNFKLNEADHSSVSLYDLSGRELKRITLEKRTEAAEEWSVPDLSSGCYLLRLSTSDRSSQSVKIIVN